MFENGREERGIELSWVERVLFKAVYRIGLFLMKIIDVITILLIFGFFALLVIFVWLMLVTVA